MPYLKAIFGNIRTYFWRQNPLLYFLHKQHQRLQIREVTNYVVLPHVDNSCDDGINFKIEVPANLVLFSVVFVESWGLVKLSCDSRSSTFGLRCVYAMCLL